MKEYAAVSSQIRILFRIDLKMTSDEDDFVSSKQDVLRSIGPCQIVFREGRVDIAGGGLNVMYRTRSIVRFEAWAN